MRKIWQALLSLGAMIPGVATAQDVPDERGHHAMRHVDDGREQRPRRNAGGFHQDAPLPPIAATPAYAERHDRARGEDRQDRSYGQYHRADHSDRRQQWQRGYADRRDDYREARRFDDRRDWNRGWRQDRRYDWNGYRSANRGAYRLPRYYAPYGGGYGYRRFGIGAALSGGLFGQNYWIDDPYEYRLPPADGPYRWVRYYDDALLVDVRTGTVVDAVYDLFD